MFAAVIYLMIRLALYALLDANAYNASRLSHKVEVCVWMCFGFCSAYVFSCVLLSALLFEARYGVYFFGSPDSSSQSLQSLIKMNSLRQISNHYK